MKEATKVRQGAWCGRYARAVLTFPVFRSTQHIEDTHRHLSATRQKYDKFQKSSVAMNVDHRVASDSLKELSANMKQAQEFHVLGEFVDKVALFSEQLQQISEQLNSDMSAQLLTPLDGVLEGDLAEAEFSKKRFNKVLSDFDAITKKIGQMNAKGQANPQKLQEAVKEQEQLQQKFNTVGQQTMQTLTDVNHRVEFAMFQTLIQYVETYHQFFSRGSALIEEASADLAKYRVFSERKREVLEQGGLAEQVRLEDIAGHEDSAAPRDALERSVQELVEKERSYVRKLDVVSKSYIQNIRVDDQLASKISPEEHRLIFSNVEELLALHKGLVLELEGDLMRYPNYTTGRILGQYLPKFRAYVPYIRNYSQSVNALDQLELRSQSVKKFMLTMDRKNGLRNLLCEPTGRIANYVIGLGQILEHTPVASDERGRMSDVVAELNKLGAELQEAQKVSTNIGTMLGVYNELAGFQGTLLEPSRVLRKEGTLEHHFMTADGKHKSELNKFYLCTDVLIQAKKKSVLESMVGKQSDTESGKKFVFVKSYVLEGASVDQLPDNEEHNVTNAFELRVAHQTGQGLLVCCATPQERLDWMNLINAMVVGTVTNAVFEVPLDLVMANQRDRSLTLPEVQVVCTEYLLKSGISIEGIFRMSGSKREIAGIISKFNRGENVVLENETSDEHSVAGVLKHWVRHLPEPLMTHRLTEDFLACESDGEKIRECLGLLPDLNLRVVSLLFYVLNVVAQRAEVNKMDSKNLAIVFAPGLLRRQGASDFDTSHYESAYAVIGFMIDNYAELFRDLTPTDGTLYTRSSSSKNPASPRALGVVQVVPRKSSIAAPTAPAPVAPGQRTNSSLQFSNGTVTRSGASSAATSPAPVSPMPVSPGPALPTKPVMVKKAGTGPKQTPTSPKTPAKNPRRNSVLKVSQNESVLEEAIGVVQEQTPSPAPGMGSAPGAGSGALAAAANRPPCSRCGEQIRGAGLKALGVAWHRDCFVCTKCEQPFTGKILQKDGKPYCEADFRTLFGNSQAKICKSCGEKISGPFMKALNAFWHAQHFVCASCGGSVSDGYYEREERPWCATCFGALEEAGEQ
jgi:hypothetical protein